MRFRHLIVLLSIAASFHACSRSSSDEKHEAAAPSTNIRYGTAMADVSHRFELLGRAGSAGRFKLAEYQLGEISEEFEETLPHATPPREGHPEVLPPLALAFLKTNVADLQSALATRDRSKFSAAFERTATACNSCHQASGHEFIEVPLVTGQSIPDTTPVPP